METHKRKLNKPPLLKIQQGKSNLSSPGLSLSRIQNNNNQNIGVLNADDSLLNDFQILLGCKDKENHFQNQSKLIIQKQNFYKKYEDALICIQAKNQQSLKRGYGILNFLASKIQKKPSFMQLIEYPIIQNVVLNLWKTSNQIGFFTKQIETNHNLIEHLKTLQEIVKQRKIKQTKLGTLCLVIAKQLYMNNQFVQALQITEKGFKYCPRNRNISLLLKIHYLKSKIYNKIQAFDLEGQQIKKCIFFMNNLNQNVQKKEFGEQFLRMLINRKQQLKKHQNQKTVAFKEKESKEKQNHSQSHVKFRTKSISLSKLKSIHINLQQAKMGKTLKKSISKNINQQKMQSQTKKMFLKLDVNHKPKLKKKIQTTWKKQTNFIQIEQQNQKIKEEIEKVNENNQQKVFCENNEKKNYPFQLLLKRPTEKKRKLKIIQQKQSNPHIQQQIPVQNENVAQIQILENNQTVHQSISNKLELNLKGLIKNLQTECLQRFVLKNLIGLNKLQEWQLDSEQQPQQIEDNYLNQNITKGKSSKFDYQTQTKMKNKQLQSFLFQQIQFDQSISSKGLIKIIKIQVNLKQTQFKNEELSTRQKEYQINSKDNMLVIQSRMKINSEYFEIYLQFQLQGYSEKEIQQMFKSKQNFYHWITTQKQFKQSSNQKHQEILSNQIKQDSLSNLIDIKKIDFQIQDSLKNIILQNTYYKKKINGKNLQQQLKQQTQPNMNQISIKNHSLLYGLRQNTFQFFPQTDNLFKRNLKSIDNNNLFHCKKIDTLFVQVLKTSQRLQNASNANIFLHDFIITEKKIFCNLHFFVKRSIRIQEQKSKRIFINNKQQLSKQFFQENREYSIEEQSQKSLSVQNKIKKSKSKQQQNVIDQLNKNMELCLSSYKQKAAISLVAKCQKQNESDLIKSLLKKTLIQFQCSKQKIINTYYQSIATSSQFRLSSNKCALINLKCFRMKKIFRKTQNDSNLYYLFEIHQQQSRTRIAKFIIEQLQLQNIYEQNQIRHNQAFTIGSLSQVLKKTCSFFIVKKQYVYSKIGIHLNKGIFYLTNKFRIIQQFDRKKQKENAQLYSNDLINQILSKNISIPNCQFVSKQIKSKQIVCQKSILINSSSNKKLKQKKDSFYAVLSVIKIVNSSHFTIRIYLPYFQRSFSINLTKSIIQYFCQETIQLLLKEAENLDSFDKTKEELIKLMFQSEKYIQISLWKKLIQVIKIEQKITQHKNYLILKIDQYNAFLKDSSCFQYFQINRNIYQIQVTLEKLKKQDIHSPNNLLQTQCMPNLKYKIGQLIQNPTQNLKQRKNQQKKLLNKNQTISFKQSQSNCFQKFQSIYQTQSSCYMLYIKISQVYTQENQKNQLSSSQINQICKIFKKQKKRKILKKNIGKTEKIESLNISFYLSEFLSFLKKNSNNYSLQFSQYYFTQAELESFFKDIKDKVIQQMCQVSKTNKQFLKTNIKSLKQKIVEKINYDQANKRQERKKFISLNSFKKQQNLKEKSNYLNLSLLSNPKKKILSIFHQQNQLLFLISNLKNFQVKKMVLNTNVNAFPYLQILSSQKQLKSVNQRLFKYFRNNLQLY